MQRAEEDVVTQEKWKSGAESCQDKGPFHIISRNPLLVTSRNPLTPAMDLQKAGDPQPDLAPSNASRKIQLVFQLLLIFGAIVLFQMGYRIQVVQVDISSASSFKNSSQLEISSVKNIIQSVKPRNPISRAHTKWHPVLSPPKKVANFTNGVHLFDNDDGENCIIGYRLANVDNNETFLHCGIDKLSPLSSEKDRCGGIPMEPGHCVLMVRGEWDAPSTDGSELQLDNPWLFPQKYGLHRINSNFPMTSQKRQIASDTNASKTSVAESVLPRCQTVSDYLNGSLQGPIFDREWVPNQCSSVPLDPYYWTQQLPLSSSRKNGPYEPGKCTMTITMMGDSHIRNLFAATVHGLRGNNFFVDGHPEGTGVKLYGIIKSYEWRMFDDGSAEDEIGVFLKVNGKDVQPWTNDYCSCDPRSSSQRGRKGLKQVQRCLRLAFVWAPTFSKQIANLKRVIEWETDLLIVEPGNVYETVALSSEWAKTMDALLEKHQGMSLGMVHWPWGEQPADRGSVIMRWINGTWNETKKDPGVVVNQSVSQNQLPNKDNLSNRKSYWDQRTLHDEKTMQGRKNWHFACAMGKERLINDVIKAVEPCTDESDTAQIRALVTVHLGDLM